MRTIVPALVAFALGCAAPDPDEPSEPLPTDGETDTDTDSEADTDTVPEPTGDTATVPDPCGDVVPLRIVDVATVEALEAALADARPGDRIVLADATYDGTFGAVTSGTETAPIALCGTRAAVLQGDSVDDGYGFHLEADHWVLSGFTVTRSQKGVMLDGANHVPIADLEVHDIGDEAIHLRASSSDNVVQGCLVHDTGRREPQYGEGIYLGSAVSNWDDGDPDRSDRNQVLDSHLGPGITTEAVDIKEGTTGGLVRGNTFDGTGMTGDNYGDSWVDVKGNGYTIEDNTGDDTLLDGFQTHVVEDGWGHDSTFRNNHMTGVPEYGVRVDGDSTGTVVGCDNTIDDGGGLGVSNVACR